MKNLNYALSTHSYRNAYNTVGLDAIKPLLYGFGAGVAAPFAAEAAVSDAGVAGLKYVFDPRVNTLTKSAVSASADALAQIVHNKGFKGYNILSTIGNGIFGNPLYSGFISTVSDPEQRQNFLWNFGVNGAANGVGSLPGMMLEKAGVQGLLKGGAADFRASFTSNFIFMSSIRTQTSSGK